MVAMYDFVRNAIIIHVQTNLLFAVMMYDLVVFNSEFELLSVFDINVGE